MSGSRLDVGFVPVECPGTTATGATHTSTLLIEHLSRFHDLTVYVSSQREADRSALPARERVDYVIHDNLSWLPHPIPVKQAAIEAERDAMLGHDLVHSYSSAFIPVLATLDVPTLVTLNSYLAICPKADFRYHGRTNCSGPGVTKCAGCVPATAIHRRQGTIAELKSAYFSFGRMALVRDSIEVANEITRYQALSPHLRQDYANAGFEPERIRVVPHFYDDQFLTNPKDRPSLDGGPIQILYVGALEDYKGVNVLVRAIPHMLSAGIAFDLHVVGAGPQARRLQTLAADLGVSERVTWHGRVEHEELPSLYRSADLFVYPGLLDEPFGRVMLEALASGLPIVSSDIGSMQAIVGDAGELFPAGDESALASAVESVLADHASYRDAISEHLQQFSPGVVVDQFNDLYVETAGDAW